MTTSAPAVSANDLCFLLSQASHGLTTALTAGLAEVGISPRSHCILSKALAGGLTQNRLAELCGLDKTTMVVAIDELEKAGLAQRRPSTTDRRARVIVVTEAGGQMVAEAQAIVDRINAHVLSALPDGERQAFVGGLVRLVGGRLATTAPCDPPVRRPRVRRSL